jgi:hypothetical protein
MHDWPIVSAHHPLRVGHLLDRKRPPEPVGDVLCGPCGLPGTVGEDHPLGTEGTRRQRDVCGHPIIPPGTVTQPEHPQAACSFLVHLPTSTPRLLVSFDRASTVPVPRLRQ